MESSSTQVKECAIASGADLCGIAPIDRFDVASAECNPADVLPGCRSVIVLAVRPLASALSTRSDMSHLVMDRSFASRLDEISIGICHALEAEGALAVPLAPASHVDRGHQEHRSHIQFSLESAAVLAGLGRIGRNSLLINDRFGHLPWLAGVLTTAELEPDPMASYEVCPEGCRLCLEVCPARSSDGVSIERSERRERALEEEDASWSRTGCDDCRRVCPRSLGIPGRRLPLHDDVVAHMQLAGMLGDREQRR